MENYLKSVLTMIATFCIFTALSGISYANTMEGISTPFVVPTTQNCGDEEEEQKEKNTGTTQNCGDEEENEDKSKK